MANGTASAGAAASASSSPATGASSALRSGAARAISALALGEPGGDAQAQGVEADEAGGIRLIVGAPVVLEGCDPRVEQRVRLRSAPRDQHRALVELEAHGAVRAFLRSVDQRLQQPALGAEPVAVVDQARVARHQVVLERQHFAVERERLDGAVRAQHDAAARGFVAAARFHADVAVLDQVEPPDAMLAAQAVELCEHVRRAQLLAVHRHDVAAPVIEL
jgi:hypothetical protein